MKLKYEKFYSKKQKDYFSLIVLNPFQIDQFKDDMYCLACKTAKLYFKSNAKTPHLAKYPTSSHLPDCVGDLPFFSSDDFSKLDAEEAKSRLKTTFERLNENDVKNFNLDIVEVNGERKVFNIIKIDDDFIDKIEYTEDFLIVGKDITITLMNGVNALTLKFNNRLKLGVSFSNSVKDKIGVVSDKIKYNIAIFGRIVCKTVNGRKYNNIYIKDVNSIEIWSNEI